MKRYPERPPGLYMFRNKRRKYKLWFLLDASWPVRIAARNLIMRPINPVLVRTAVGYSNCRPVREQIGQFAWLLGHRR